MDLLGLERKVILASSIQVETDDPTLRLVKICQHLDGDAYLSGKDGAKYMDEDMFRSQKIQVVFQDFNHPEYPQCYGTFEPNMSVVDLLFNCGPDSLAIIREASI
jgi:hypothetical protein